MFYMLRDVVSEFVGLTRGENILLPLRVLCSLRQSNDSNWLREVGIEREKFHQWDALMTRRNETFPSNFFFVFSFRPFVLFSRGTNSLLRICSRTGRFACQRVIRCRSPPRILSLKLSANACDLLASRLDRGTLFTPSTSFHIVHHLVCDSPSGMTDNESRRLHAVLPFFLFSAPS